MRSLLTRRRFLSQSAKATMAIAAPAIFPRGMLGAASPNERIVTGHIGLGGMGRGHLSFFRDMCGALCDVDANHMQRAAGRIGRYVPLYKDFRALLDQRDLDAVIIATPDHWHAVMMINACEAGKDVYCQKPLSLTLEEGQKMVKAAKRCNRIVQVGSQGRSTPSAYKACGYVRNGQIGRVKEVRCWHYPNPVGGYAPDEPPPPHLDWDMWLGPVRYVPYNRDRVHFNFRWLLEFGGGQIRDRGAHVMSVASWIMNADNQPIHSIEATGNPPKQGLWDCPVEMNVKFEFKNPDWTMYWQQPGEPKMGAGFGATYHGEKGELIVTGGDGGCGTEDKAENYTPPSDGVQPYKSPGHEQDWVNCIKTREQPIMNIDAGYTVANLCILGNLSYIVGRKLYWDKENERCINDPEANRMLSRPNRAPWRL